MSPGSAGRLSGVATYVLIPGAGGDAWYWHLVAPKLRSLGHEVVAVDLPCDDDTAGFEEYAGVVVKAEPKGPSGLAPPPSVWTLQVNGKDSPRHIADGTLSFWSMPSRP